MSYGVLNVFTAKPKEEILARGGSDSWVIKPSSLKHVEFCVCSRNDDSKYDVEHGGPRPEPRNQAFLVGRISGYEFVERLNNRDRYRVLFSEYAEVAVDDYRFGSIRNPVTYSDYEHSLGRGLDLEKLNWKPMPPRVEAPEQAVKGLSIAEAKKGLSVEFNVPVEAIQITISA